MPDKPVRHRDARSRQRVPARRPPKRGKPPFSQGPEGRRLRQEAGLAHRRRASPSGPITGRSTAGARRPDAAAPGQFPFVRGIGGLGAAEARRRRRDPRRPAARGRRHRRPGTRLRPGRRRRAAGRAGRDAAGGRRRRAGRVRLRRRLRPTSSRSPSCAPRACCGRRRWRPSARAGDAVPHADLRRARRARNKSIYDRYTNLLRVTTEALSAVIGGCDQLYGGARSASTTHLALERAAHPPGGGAPGRGGRPGRRLLLHRGADRRAGARGLEAVPAGRGRRRLRQGRSPPAPSSRRWPRPAPPGRRPSSSRRRTLVGVNNYPNLDGEEPRRRRSGAAGSGLRAGPAGRAVRADPAAHRAHAAAAGQTPEGAAAEARRRQDAEARAPTSASTSSAAPASTSPSRRATSGDRRRPDRAVQLRRRVPRPRAGSLRRGRACRCSWPATPRTRSTR